MLELDALSTLSDVSSAQGKLRPGMGDAFSQFREVPDHLNSLGALAGQPEVQLRLLLTQHDARLGERLVHRGELVLRVI